MNGNLVSLADRTTEEQRAIARQGGIASGEARREKKRLRELLEAGLSEPFFDLMEGYTDRTNAQEMCAALIRKACAGNVRAFVEIRNTVGEMPAQRIEETAIAPEVYERVERVLSGEEA